MYGFSNSSSPTPVSDGEKVWFINASGKVVCFDLDGNQIWERSWRPISKIGKQFFHLISNMSQYYIKIF